MPPPALRGEEQGRAYLPMSLHFLNQKDPSAPRRTGGILPDHRRARKHSSSDSDGEKEFGKPTFLEGTRASQESSGRLSILLELGRLGMLNSLHLGRSGRLGGAALHAATTGSGNPCSLVGCSDDDEKAVGIWKLSGYYLPENYMKNYVGGGDAREIGNWNLSSYFWLGNCKENYFGTGDKREVENSQNNGGDDENEAADWELIGHGGDDEREIGNWGMIGHGGDDEKEAGNLLLTGDDKREVGSRRLIGRGGDDEREVGNWRLMRCGSGIAKELSLEDLEYLNDLRLTLNSMSSLLRLFTSNVLLTLTRFLCLKNCKGLTSAHVQSALSNLRNLWRLHISSCPDLEELVIGGEGAPVNSLEIFMLSNLPIRKIDISCASHIKISGLVISGCPNLKNVAFVRQLGHLEEISIIDCDQMDHLVGEKDERVMDETVDLPKLKRLTLARLPRLQAIGVHKLALPSLEYLHVRQCDRLREFPFDKQSAKHLREIRDPIESWIALEKEYEIIDSAPFPSVSCTQCENLFRDAPHV